MRRTRCLKHCINMAAFALTLAGADALAAAMSYTGSLGDGANTALIGSGPAPSAPDFTDDDAIANNVALYAFSVATTQTVEFRSLGFGEGGVDPYFTLFAGGDGTAALVGSNFDQAFATGGDFDLTFMLAAGDYQFALGAFANESFAENGGGTLADGFIGLGASYSLGDGHYHVDVTTMTRSPPAVPEPATVALWSAVLAAWAVRRMGRSTHASRPSRRPGSLSQAQAQEDRTMKTTQVAMAAIFSMVTMGIAAAPTNAAAQIRAALVQNVDEPGRSPYQEHLNATCFSSCTLTFSAVPAGMRLVVTHVNGTVDTFGNGVPPHVVFRSNLFGSGNFYATLPVVRGITVGNLNQMVVDDGLVAYFNAGEQPVLTGDLNVELSTSITDRLAGPSSATLTGYYIKLP